MTEVEHQRKLILRHIPVAKYGAENAYDELFAYMRCKEGELELTEGEPSPLSLLNLHDEEEVEKILKRIGVKKPDKAAAALCDLAGRWIFGFDIDS